ncbi:hypothetical protein BpHYR1_031186 [Brachionus plicatilis]|uniref:Uncharacterized protein n=1 Tax=Brachionus plicatilis TaxID=10195 RepID=A0A3M7R127_BRAPC|nr:hypothetical protein BpHYR1_031186 [Brachionus plicatilis]
MSCYISTYILICIFRTETLIGIFSPKNLNKSRALPYSSSLKSVKILSLFDKKVLMKRHGVVYSYLNYQNFACFCDNKYGTSRISSTYIITFCSLYPIKCGKNLHNRVVGVKVINLTNLVTYHVTRKKCLVTFST